MAVAPADPVMYLPLTCPGCTGCAGAHTGGLCFIVCVGVLCPGSTCGPTGSGPEGHRWLWKSCSEDVCGGSMLFCSAEFSHIGQACDQVSSS